MTILAFIPMNIPIRHLMEYAWFASSSAVTGFPLPLDFPVASLGGPFGGSFGCGELPAAGTEDLAGDALAGTAGVLTLGLIIYLSRRDCSMDRAFTSSRSSTNNC